MKAVVFEEHGDSSVLAYCDVPRPVPGTGEVLVAVRAVSVNHGPDIETRRRGFSMGAVAMPHIGGVDPAGEVAEVGRGVTGWKPGDRVAVYPVLACGECEFCLAGAPENMCSRSLLFGVQTPGGRAEYLTVPATQLVALPDNVSFEDAAALGVAYTTTWHGMKRAGVGKGDTLLVIGAGGGVGAAAVQLGKLVGAEVIGVTGSESKQRRVSDLGADHVFSYRDPDWVSRVRAATGDRGVSVAFDNGGTETFPATVETLARAGRVFCSGGTTGFDISLNVRRLYRDHITLYFYVQGSKADMTELVGFVADGRLRPVIDAQFPLSRAAEADDRLDAQQQVGRIILTVP